MNCSRPSGTRTLRLLSFAFGVCGLFLVTPVQAAEIPWTTKTYSHYSNSEPLRNMVNSFFGSHGVPAIVSKKIKDVVSLSFSDISNDEVLERLAKTYNLTWYYDGNVVYVYHIDEIQTGTLMLKHISVKEFTDAIERMGIYDPRISWTLSERDGLLHFAGPARYVEMVMESAKVIDRAPVAQALGVAYRWIDARGVRNLSSAPPSKDVVNYEVVDLGTFQVQAR
ncbi:MAG: secretin N-terminal domain-containing protein [Thiotrichales bacterium]